MSTDIKQNKKILSVVIPTFNEINNIERILNELLDLSIPYEKEIIVVDDNSLDGTSELVRNIAQRERRVRLINRFGRCGLSSAIKEGSLCASGDLIVIMDADGQHETNSIIDSLNILEKKKVDIVIGSRFLEGSVIKGLTNQRKKGSSIANALSRLSLYGKYNHITDYMSGFIILKRIACIKYIEKIDVNGFKFLYELLAISKGKLKVKETPLAFQVRTFGNSKLDISVGWDFFISLIHNFSGRLLPRRAVSFALVGSSGVLVQFLVIYTLLWNTQFNFEAILPIGVIVAATSNYIINNLLTFRSRKLKGKRFYFGLLKFLLVSSLPIIANIGVTNLFYNQFSSNTLISQLAGIIVVFIWNYAASSKVVWNN